MTPKRSDVNDDGKRAPDRVAQALDIYRSILACHEYRARRDGVHALTAGLMLPCYQAEFGRLTLELSRAEESELRFELRQIRESRQCYDLPDRAVAQDTL
ncbi:hypothetical protein [Variovorax guangxiensis]|uniref:hypothetical protein n=1 Tax=Variovorax guangxiensis TaxID=1775474 RepID=UPI00285424B5|nr:hypothetical protein [Variovorax guangxiensis]MDR6858986.1 hypothetical protein [Variovorax guangxiensis]